MIPILLMGYRSTGMVVTTVVISLIQNLGIEIQRAYNKHIFCSFVYSFMAIGNILISIPLCIKFGGIGCAAGTAISFILANGLVMNIYYHVKLHIDMKYFWVQIIKFIPALIIPVITGVLLSVFVNCYNLINLLICIAVYAMVYNVLDKEVLSLCPNEFLIHNICHMTKHFADSGINLRHLMDITILINSHIGEFDIEYIMTFFKKIKIDEFVKYIFNFCNKYLGMCDIPEIDCSDIDEEVSEEFISDLFEYMNENLIIKCESIITK